MAKKVMVVDDATFMRMTIRKMLDKMEDIQVVGEAANGLEAVSLYPILKPDLITMDITMPEMDGLSAVKAIMKLDPNAKIVMMSAMGQEAMVREAIISGAKNFLVKPFKEDKFRQVITSVLE